MKNCAIWNDRRGFISYPSLKGIRRYDVAVIGAGITGITAAQILKRRGKRVALIDRHEPLQGETGRTTAHITEILDLRYTDLADRFGMEAADQMHRAQRAAMRFIHETIRERGIECQYRPCAGYVFTEDHDDADHLEQELITLNRLGIEATMTPQCPLPFPVVASLRIDDQAQFHPLAYLEGFLEGFEDETCQIFANSAVTKITDGEPCQVETDEGKILCDEVLVCTNVPISDRFALHTKVAAYRSYALGVNIQNTADVSGLFWDTAEPYHYIRDAIIDGERLLIIGGEDHKTGTEVDTDAHYNNLIEYTMTRFPSAQIRYRWSGQIIESVDGLPYIGRDSFSSHIYVATGYSGNGMTNGTLAGIMLADLAVGIENSWHSLLKATRVHPIISAPRYLFENKDFPAYFLRDRIATTPEVSTLLPGDGAVVEIDGERLAVYRAQEGELRAHSAVCPHLHCLVRWNKGEKTWDCPCHGSRFDKDGDVLNGPAVSGLREIALDGSQPEPHIEKPRHDRTAHS